MAFFAGDIGVRALQLELRVAVVIKFFRQPVDGRVAAVAMRHAVFFRRFIAKLSQMDVPVAGLAFARQRGKHKLFCRTG